MKVLIDSSVWIDYFKSEAETNELDYLIDSHSRSAPQQKILLSIS